MFLRENSHVLLVHGCCVYRSTGMGGPFSAIFEICLDELRHKAYNMVNILRRNV